MSSRVDIVSGGARATTCRMGLETRRARQAGFFELMFTLRKLWPRRWAPRKRARGSRAPFFTTVEPWIRTRDRKVTTRYDISVSALQRPR
eukprot:3966128-Pyramimonas_sp.AAC.1